ncbi:MAG: hypothetical protein IPL06_09625 [Betaproteobacteria bacterium]|nr:hypothetical protein [Betaproteobacteria bacterium]
MNRKTLLAGVTVLAVAALAWDWMKGRPDAAPAPSASAAASAAKAGGSSASAGLVTPGGAPVTAAVNFLKPAAVRETATPLSREYTAAKTYKALYDRLKDSPEGRTPEGQYYLYQMLRACATVADRKSSFAPTRGLSPTMLQERRERVLAEIPEGSVVREQRLAALDQLSVDKCEGMGGITIPESELNGLLKAAALGGDPKARLVQTEAEMWAERRSANASRPGFVRPTLNDAQLDAVKGAFTSRDPEAIALAGNLLTQQFRDVSLRLGTDTEPVDPSAIRNAAFLLACEYGYPCGANAPAVLSGCAIQGRCGVASLADYLYYFSASPYEAQAIDRYRAILRQVSDSGDTSGLAFARLPSVINSSTTTTTVVSPGTSTPRK